MEDKYPRGFIDYLNELWNAFVRDGGLMGIPRLVAENCEIAEVRGNTILLALVEKYSKSLNDRVENKIKDAFQKYRNEAVFLVFTDWKSLSDKAINENESEEEKENLARLTKIRNSMDKQAENDEFSSERSMESLIRSSKTLISFLECIIIVSENVKD